MQSGREREGAFGGTIELFAFQSEHSVEKKRWLAGTASWRNQHVKPEFLSLTYAKEARWLIAHSNKCAICAPIREKDRKKASWWL